MKIRCYCDCRVENVTSIKMVHLARLGRVKRARCAPWESLRGAFAQRLDELFGGEDGYPGVPLEMP